MKFHQLVICFLICMIYTSLFNSICAQEFVMMYNSQGVEKDRYENIKGSPYLYDDWQYGKTVNSKSEIIDSLQINYNGYTHNIEVKKDDVFIELDAYHYPLVVIYSEDGKENFFRRNSSKTLFNRYTRMVFSGLEFLVVEDFNTRIEVKKVNDVGVIRETETFVHKKNYYIIKDNKAKLLKMKKGFILKELGNEGELDNFLKQNKLKLNSEENMIKLFEFFDKSGFIYN